MAKLLAWGSLALMLLAAGGCDQSRRLCSPGAYRPFVLETTNEGVYGQPYNAATDHITLWLMAEALEGESCLPRDLEIGRVSAPEGCHVVVTRPQWIKGVPRMAVHIDEVRALPAGEEVSVDIRQAGRRRQTIVISVVRDPEVQVIVDGQRVKVEPDP